MKIFYKIFYGKYGNAQISWVQSALSPLSKCPTRGFEKDEKNCSLWITRDGTPVLSKEEQGVLLSIQGAKQTWRRTRIFEWQII
jgi:hypothetical protein